MSLCEDVDSLILRVADLESQVRKLATSLLEVTALLPEHPVGSDMDASFYADARLEAMCLSMDAAHELGVKVHPKAEAVLELWKAAKRDRS